MSLFQFLRILWAYKFLVVACALLSLGIAVIFAQTAKPRYEAQARVMLDVVKPDPVTGQIIATAFLKAYTKTQIELVKDTQVASRVVKDLGWATNPAIQEWYKTREKGAELDFDRWAAQQVVQGTSARLIEGSNILEITYSSASPTRAKEVAESLRKAYVDMTLQSRREGAKRNAEWYEAQAEKTKLLLLRAEQAKADFERQSGIILQDNKIDLDSARLSALAGQGGAPTLLPSGGGMSSSAMQLAQLDSDIAQAGKTLGPNHPQLVEMRRRREFIANQAKVEESESGSAAAAAMGAARAASSVLDAQKTKVMAQREKVEQLRLLQDAATIRRDQYNQAIMRAAQLRQEAEVAISGVTTLGAAVTPQAPVFPQKGRIIGVSIPIGIGIGLVLSMLLEFVGRRVRGPDDMATIIGAPVLAVIQGVKHRRTNPLAAIMPVISSRLYRQPRPANG